ncbi:Sucrose transport protein suc3 [Turnera subulata]|uniref:Sucrose transport protein suc3 n=1 Tax=Turnera subulata TaxID=218843 RepID=A0A9Q0J9K8_9ROSI|nr:Sucrose transport protein suc3 [Turnera subulata]
MMEPVSVHVPYRNLRKDVEVEMVGVEDTTPTPPPPQPNRRIHLDSASPSSSAPNGDSDFSPPRPQSTKHYSLITLVLSCTVAAGVQFGWALQLSLLTPYVQASGLSHSRNRTCVFIIHLALWSHNRSCGSVEGLLGLATYRGCSTFKGTRTRAAFVFVIGFWMLDLANNTVQGPARALLADLAGPDQRNSANAVFCTWMAVGNILGFSAGASGSWNRWFPFLTSRACCEACGNLKAAFLVAVVFLTFCTIVTIYFAKEDPLNPNPPHRLSDSAPLLNEPQQNGLELTRLKSDMSIKSNGMNDVSGYDGDQHSTHSNSVDYKNETFNDGPGAVLVNLLTSLRHLPPGMHAVLTVMALTWLSWFPFFLFDTDWMGREVYHGDPKGSTAEVKLYDQGVREGAFGLLLNSVVLGISSFFIEPMCQRMGARIVWALSNFIVFACMAITAVISLISVGELSEGVENAYGGSASIRIAALLVFTLLGFPLAITYSVPFSVTAELTADSGGGQGLAIGVLNLAIVIPQMIVSIGAGPWDELFGGGNIPAFVLASVAALAAGVIACLKLPILSSSSFKSSGFHFG